MLAIAVLARLAVMGQSLWYDEIYTIRHFLYQPWLYIVVGRYTPNNHVLFTLLSRICYELIPLDVSLVSRLPSLVAGSLVAAVLAWPLRRSRPWLALAIGASAALNPWLVSISGWARGYALLLLLAVVSTVLLDRRRKGFWYGLSLVAVLYTHPIAALLLPAQLAVLSLARPFRVTRIARTAATQIAAVGIAVLLYGPMLESVRGYWSFERPPSTSYGGFVLQSFTAVGAGYEYARGAAAHAVVAALVVMAGGALAWRRWPALRAVILTFAIASGIGLLVPLAAPSSGEPRAMIWLIPLHAVGLAALAASAASATGAWLPTVRRVIRVACWMLPLGLLLWRVTVVSILPTQPIADALDLAGRTLAHGQRVVAIYMGGIDARVIYGEGRIDYVAMRLSEERGPDHYPALITREQKLNFPPLAVVFYESLLHERDPELWAYLQTNYRLIGRYPGRLDSCAVYELDPAVHARLRVGRPTGAPLPMRSIQ